MKHIDDIRELVDQLELNVMGIPFHVHVKLDSANLSSSRMYLQLRYLAPDWKNPDAPAQLWRGRKWWLSPHMTDDEVIKTVYLALRTAVEHEVLEGFRIDGLPVFNPHTPYTELRKASHIEVRREPQS